MAKSLSTFQVPPSLAIAEGATTPDPGGTSALGVVVWSTTTSALMRWSGTAWNAVSAGGGGSFSNTIVSAAPSANQQNWSVAGLTAFSTVQATQTDSAFVGGIVAGSDGQVLRIINRGGGMLWLVDEDPESTAANRLSMPEDLAILLPNDVAELQYSSAAARWVLTYVNRQVMAFDHKGIMVLPSLTNTVSVLGTGSVTTQATLSTVEPTQNGNLFTGRAYTQITNAGSLGASEVRSNQLRWFRGALADRSGFLFGCTFRNPALGATGGFFAGLIASTAAQTTVPRNISNSIGIGTQNGETTHRVYSRDGATVTAVDLGANFPSASASAAYQFYLFAPPASSSVHYAIRRLDTEFKASGVLTANLPAQTQGLSPRVLVVVGTTAVANTGQFGYMSCRSVF